MPSKSARVHCMKEGRHYKSGREGLPPPEKAASRLIKPALRTSFIGNGKRTPYTSLKGIYAIVKTSLVEKLPIYERDRKVIVQSSTSSVKY